MSVAYLFGALVGVLIAMAGYYLLQHARKLADANIDLVRKGPIKPPKWLGSESGRQGQAASYKLAGAIFLIAGCAIALINLLIFFGVITPIASQGAN